MNYFDSVFASEISELVASALLHFVWQGAILALILFFTVKIGRIRSARTRHLLSNMTLLSMALAPVLTMVWSLYDTVPMRAEELSGQPPTGFPGPFQVSDASNSEWRQLSTIWHRPDFRLAVLFLWLSGVVILSTRLVFGFAMTLWIRAKVKPLDEILEQKIRSLGQRLRINSAKRVYSSMRISQAMALGFIRPIVLIPAAWLTELSPQILEAVIAHELAHIRRWDLWVNLLQRVIEVLLFYHPAVWWLSHRICLEREMCCDEIAADCLDRAAYARSLESVARISRGNLLLATSIQGATQMNLLNRVRYLLGSAPAESAGNWWAAGFAGIAVPVLATIAIAMGAGPTSRTAIADDGKATETQKSDPEAVQQNDLLSITLIGDGDAVPDHDLEITPGYAMAVRMSGDVAKEWYRLMLPGRKFKPGDYTTVVGKITEVLPDGRFKIENNIPVENQGQVVQQFSMTVVAERSRIKSYPKPEKDLKTLFKVEGKPASQKFKPSSQSESDILTFEIKNVGGEDVPMATEINYTLVATDISRSFVEVSDLKSVTFKLWELKEQVGK